MCTDEESISKHMHLTERTSKTMFLRDHFSGRFQTMSFVGSNDKFSNNCQDNTLFTYILDLRPQFEKAFNRTNLQRRCRSLDRYRLQTPRKTSPASRVLFGTRAASDRRVVFCWKPRECCIETLGSAAWQQSKPWDKRAVTERDGNQFGCVCSPGETPKLYFSYWCSSQTPRANFCQAAYPMCSRLLHRTPAAHLSQVLSRLLEH